jgi:hypothetical protein
MQRKALLEKLLALQLIRNTHFMQAEGSLQCSKKPTNGPPPQTDTHGPYHPTPLMPGSPKRCCRNVSNYHHFASLLRSANSTIKTDRFENFQVRITKQSSNNHNFVRKIYEKNCRGSRTMEFHATRSKDCNDTFGHFVSK